MHNNNMVIDRRAYSDFDKNQNGLATWIFGPSGGPAHTKSVTRTIVGRPMAKSLAGGGYSTVTDLARFLGWSTLQPRITAMW